MSAIVRIGKLLTAIGYGTRREVKAMAYAGRITLDSIRLTDVEGHIALTPDLALRMTVDSAPLDPLPGMVVMLHKPRGVTCSHKESGTMIYDLLPGRWKRRNPQISSVGRLDKDTSGLLLLTDDGLLLHKMISPKKHVAKTYLVTHERALKGDEIAIFASGTLMLEGESRPLKPAELQVISPTTVRITLHEGRYHQVRRMFAAVANHVTVLHRESIGGLTLSADQKNGDYRVLNAMDIAKIFYNGIEAMLFNSR